jgi:NTP pyrophosphatase (non-canonical NTP hydrolase)
MKTIKAHANGLDSLTRFRVTTIHSYVCWLYLARSHKGIAPDEEAKCQVSAHYALLPSAQHPLSQPSPRYAPSRALFAPMSIITGFDEYQEIAMGMAFYPDIGNNFVYPTLGLVGEAGEVSEKIKKLIRDDGSIITASKRQQLKEELGDVLWYVSALAVEFHLSLSEIATANIEKLQHRKERGALRGEGDHR